MGAEASRGALNQVRMEWFAAVFGLLTGLTMAYVPYEFGTSVFKLIYPHIRLLGTAFLVGSATMLVALLYPSWSVWVGRTGRTVFLGALAFYWWRAAVLTGGLTGILVYPMLVAAFLAERLPRWRSRGLFPEFLLATALAFGTFLLVDPTWLGPNFYPVLRPVGRPLGAAFLVGGLLLAAGQWRGWPRLTRGAVGGLTLLFLVMALAAGARGSWTGMELYSGIVLCGVLLLFLGQRPEMASVGWRLFRGVALAAVLPILAVGGLASVFAQKAIERELRDKARQAVEAEIAWLEQSVAMARFLLLTQSEDPVLLAALRARDADALGSRLRLLCTQPGPFDAAWVLDDTGEALHTPFQLPVDRGNFSHRDYFQEGRVAGEVYVSRPFANVRGTPMVTFSTPVRLDGGRQGVLVAGMSLLRLGRELTFASRNYHVEILDRRAGELLRETDQGRVLTRAPVLDILLGSPLSVGAVPLAPPSGPGVSRGEPTPPDDGIVDAADASGRRLLVAHAQVPGTPWTVAVTSPLRHAFAAVTRLSAIVVLIALVAGGVALWLSRWVGRDTAQRLTALRDGFAVLGTPERERPLPARGDDELAQLTEGFNEMAARIERTQKELREAISSRDQFMSIASHELRTPLTPLKATIELLLRQSRTPPGLTPERLAGMLDRLRRQVDRLTRLIGDMLDVSRLQSGRFTLRPARMDLSALTREVVDRIEHSRAERSAPIPVEMPGEPVVGVWDDQRLDQLLTNLVENAVRYSPPDRPIHVRVRPEPGGVNVEVEDQGIGVSAESLPHLFEPFFRAQNASEHHAGGLGLGLAICREIVERHGGRIHAESLGQGQGTRFHVFLPHGEPPREGVDAS